MSLSDIAGVRSDAGLWGTRITLLRDGASESVTLPLLTVRSAREIEIGVGVAREAVSCHRAIIEALSSFQARLDDSVYFNRSALDTWLDQAQPLVAKIPDPSDLPHRIQESLSSVRHAVRLRHMALRAKSVVQERNDAYVRRTAREYATFFEALESNPLTPRQIEAILRDEDQAVVVAGAGTGKTSTVVGKVGFLIEHGDATPAQILALAFARKAKAEMEARIAARTGHEVEVRTFHSLGRQVVISVEGEKVAIASMASHEKEMLHWVSAQLASLLVDPVHGQRVASFVVFHRYPARYLDEFASVGEYLKYMRKQEPQTLRGEWVKSFEELLIADWMTLHGIRYEYEAAYEHQTATRRARQYKPDFYLPEYGIYLEHFGIGRDGSTAPGISPQRYSAGMQWKRQLHGKYRTRLLETYSYQRMEGTILRDLERMMKDAGVRVNRISPDELRGIITHSGVHKPLVALLKDFLTVFKENQWSMQESRSVVAGLANPQRGIAFLDLFEMVYSRYEEHLRGRQELDFADLIARATQYVESGRYLSPFTRIIVDEFQDISRGRQRLLDALLNQPGDRRLMAVGDDWQSIYGFTGSDVEMMTSFPSRYPHAVRVDLDQTFRFNDGILHASSAFIQENPHQLRKTIRSNRVVGSPAIELHESLNHKITDILARIEVARDRRKRSTVLLLGRYNFTEPAEWRSSVTGRYPELDVEFLTVHKAKGLEADYVIVLDLRGGRYGFPSEIATDPLMSLVIPMRDSHEYAEERRVFYVAMTRARHGVYLLCDSGRRSRFADELKTPRYGHWVAQFGDSNGATEPCPECGVGVLFLKHPNRPQGYAWYCDSSPYCEGRARFCLVCRTRPRSAGRETCAAAVCVREHNPEPAARRPTRRTRRRGR